jgi:hypothetical protein
MRRSVTLAAVVAVLGVLVVGAGTVLAQDVSVNYVPGTDFSKYKSYKWVQIQGAEKPDQIIDSQITLAIDKALAAGGLTKVTGDKADLYIAYQIAYTKEQQWTTYNVGGPYAWRYGGGTGMATSSTIAIGTVALDMFDPAAKELVWKGKASKTLSNEKDPAKRQKNIDKAMAKLLKDFPPKPKK